MRDDWDLNYDSTFNKWGQISTLIRKSVDNQSTNELARIRDNQSTIL